jgi:hypothetical protein
LLFAGYPIFISSLFLGHHPLDGCRWTSQLLDQQGSLQLAGLYAAIYCSLSVGERCGSMAA